MVTKATDRIAPRTEALDQCPICHSKDAKFFLVAPDRLHGVPGEFSYEICNNCRTVFQNPRVIPEDLFICYPSDYYTHAPEAAPRNISDNNRLSAPSGDSFRAKLRQSVIDAIKGQQRHDLIGVFGKLLSKNRTLRERAFYGVLLDELLPRQLNHARALEIGCGSGDLLARLKSVGWCAEGLEWDSEAARLAETNSGCSVRVGDVRELEDPPGSFDLIVLHHVFEHLPSPIESLKAVRDLLSPIGKAVLVYPNPDSLGAKFFKTNWFPWDPPRHLFFAPISSIHVASHELGFGFSARTSSRTAEYCSAKSRRYKSGKMDEGYSVTLDRWDFWFKRIELCLILAGLPLGEEIFVVLQKGKA